MKQTFFIIGFIAIISNIFGNPSKKEFDHISSIDGLSDNTVKGFYQDSKGYIWIITENELNKYDGINFYDLHNVKNKSLYNKINVVVEDSNGFIWLGGSELEIYNPSLNSVRQIIPDKGNKNSFQGGNIYDMVVDIDKTIWIAASNGLAHYIPNEDRFITFSQNEDSRNYISSNVVHDIYIASDDVLYIAPEAEHIYRYDRMEESFIPVTYMLMSDYKSYRKSITEGNNRVLYIHSEKENYLHLYYPQTNSSEMLISEDLGLYETPITCLLFASSDELWFGTKGKGIGIYNLKNNSLKYVAANLNTSNSLPGNSINTMFKDKHDNIWIGHSKDGISILKKNRKNFHSYFYNAEDDSSLARGNVNTAYKDMHGKIWIGTDQCILSMFDEKSNVFHNFPLNEPDNTSSNNCSITSICEGAIGKLLIGTSSRGLLEFDINEGLVTKVYQQPEGLSARYINALLKINTGEVIIATQNSGFDIFETESGSFTNYIHGINKIACSGSINTIAEGPGGIIWFGTRDKGICTVDLSNDSTKNYTFNKNDTNSISSNNVTGIAFKDTIVWITTYGGGLNKFSGNTKKFSSITKRDGLPTNSLSGLLLDKNNYIWIGSNRGLIKYNIQNKAITIYNETERIHGSIFNPGVQVELNDGRMLFGGDFGLTIFNPDSILDNNIKPKVVFTDLKVLHKSVKIGESSILKKHIDDTPKLKFRHNHKVFTLEFASLDFTSPKNNRFKYKLEGFDEEWIQAENKNFATYTNLNPGRYEFKVIGSNSDGIFNKTHRSIEIKVAAPLYKNKLLIAFVVIILIYGIVLFIRRREEGLNIKVRRLKKKIKRGRHKLEKTLSEIEKRNKELQLKNNEKSKNQFESKGIAIFNELIAKKRNDLKKLSIELISGLVKYLHANAGVIFVVDNSNPEDITLKSIAEFGFDYDIQKNKEFGSNEGYVGTCYKEKKVLKIEDVPEGYVVLRSGLGEISLSNTVLVPILHDTDCLGVIEIASTEKLPEHKISFIETLVKSFATVLAIAKANELTKNMIEENKMQSEELVAHEEELRQNLEEMKATQEDLKRQIESSGKMQEELRTAKALLDAMLNNMPDYIYFKYTSGEFIRISKSMVPLFHAKSVNDVIGKTDFDFHPEQDAKKYFAEEQKIIETGNGIVNDINHIVMNDTDEWVTTTKMPLYDETGKCIGTFGISSDITEIKKLELEALEKSEELAAQKEEILQNLEEMRTIQEKYEEQMETNKQYAEKIKKLTEEINKKENEIKKLKDKK